PCSSQRATSRVEMATQPQSKVAMPRPMEMEEELGKTAPPRPPEEEEVMVEQQTAPLCPSANHQVLHISTAKTSMTMVMVARRGGSRMDSPREQRRGRSQRPRLCSGSSINGRPMDPRRTRRS